MDEERLDKLSRWFEDYAQSFADASGRLSKPAECKLVHTREVRAASARIAKSRDGANLSGSLALLAEGGGLLHDVARFEQYKRFKTFADARSFDHGDEGAKMIERLKLLEGLPESEASLLIEAVRLHNKPFLPKGLGKDGETTARIVRDADKAGILQFIARYFNEEFDYWRDPAISLEAPDTGTYTESVIQGVLKGGMVLHKDIHCVDDFILALFAWPADINFGETAKLILEERLYDKIGKHLPENKQVEELFKITSERLRKIAGRHGESANAA